MTRVIGHIDIDYFYAQVEELLDPSLKSRPVVVCVYSGRTEDSGVVSTANYVARRFGVQSGMPISLAQKKLAGADGAFIKLQLDKYKAISEKIMQTIKAEVDALEQVSIDEAFFDITNSSKEDYSEARKIAMKLKDDILQLHGLTSSIGIGRTKVIAKIASDISKPNGLFVVQPHQSENFLWSLPVKKLYGVGPRTAATLKERGILTVGDLANRKVEELENLFGRKLAVYLLRAAHGEDDAQVTESNQIKQLSRIITLKRDTGDPLEAYKELSPAINDLAKKLSEKGFSFRTLTIIGILDDYSMHTKSRTFETRMNSAALLNQQSMLLLTELANIAKSKLRRVGIRVSDLVEGQASLNEYL